MADKASIFLLCTILALLATLVIFAMKYYVSLREAQARVVSEGSYRSLTERAVAAEETAASALGSLSVEIADLAHRLGRIETILKDVE